jgi:acyl carrier protein
MTTGDDRIPASEAAIYEKLTSIFRALFEDPSIVLTPQTNEADIAGWDSFTNVSLIAAIEEAYAIRFRTAELQSLNNIGRIVEVIRAKQKSAN